MADRWMLGETAALDDYIPNAPTNILGDAAQGVKDWYTSQPSWLDRAKAENQKTLEAYGRGGMGEIAKQLATDTTEPQELYGAFGVGNIKGVKPPLAPGALAATSEYHPPFYSAVEQAVQGAKQNAAPGQQWAGFLRNQPGVKPEEVEALGLGKLFEQPGAVPKQAVLGEIAANRVNVGEVMKGGERPTTFSVSSAGNLSGAPALRMDFATAAEANAELARRQASYGGYHSMAELPTPESRTKFEQYTLPGGENYREMLLTLPKKPVDIGPAPELITELPKGPDWENSYRVLRYRGDGPEREWGVIPPGQSHARSMVGQHPTEAEAVRQALNHINAQNAQQYNQALHDANKSGQFTSSHFDEPNVLAHVRYNDRVIDGKKTLFVEEVQSDWHQKGRERGYKEGEPQTIPSFTADQLKIHETEHQYVGTTPDGRQQVVGKGTVGDEDGAREYLTRYMNKQAAERNMSAVQAHNAKVPNAPFKTTWPELAMKRIIREAAEKGYDKVAWTPGSVQAARYPEQLRQHVDEIAWSSPGTPRSNPEGLRYVHAKPRAGGMDLVFTVNKDGMITEASAAQAKGQHVEDIFGKDMSRQIMEKADGEIASKDFVIGAKGQQGFYDEILPATVNRLVKKHGGRVTQADMTAATAASPERVHSLDITPSLRAAAMKGFPLFTAGGVAATGIMGEMARQDEYR